MSESQEDYLKAILTLKGEHSYVRAIDIAEYMGFSKPSVSIALKGLCTNGLAYIDENGVELTQSGQDAASEILQKYHFLTRFLVSLGVSPERAGIDAHKVEHAISSDSFAALKKYFASDMTG